MLFIFVDIELLNEILKNNLELIFWVCALMALGFSDQSKAQFIVCPLRLLGFTWCPGCGIGHAIGFLLHGDIKASFGAHWLGIPALVILLFRIYTLAVVRYSIPGA